MGSMGWQTCWAGWPLINRWQPFQKVLWPFGLACMYMGLRAFFCCCSSAFSTTSMLIDRRSVILLNSDLVLRTAERSLGMAKVMMTARPFLVPARPCLLAPDASTWLESLPRISHPCQQIFFCFCTSFFQSCAPHRTGGIPLKGDRARYSSIFLQAV